MSARGTIPREVDVAVVGGGVVGCAIARALSRFELDVCLIDRETDVGFGTSKANSGIIHAGHHSASGTLKGTLEWAGNQQWGPLADELGIGFERVGDLTVAFDEDEVATLERLRRQAVEVALPCRSPRGRRCDGKPGSARDGAKYKGDANEPPHVRSGCQHRQELAVDGEDIGDVQAVQHRQVHSVTERGAGRDVSSFHGAAAFFQIWSRHGFDVDGALRQPGAGGGWPQGRQDELVRGGQGQVRREEQETAAEKILIGGGCCRVRGVVPVRQRDERRRVDERNAGTGC